MTAMMLPMKGKTVSPAIPAIRLTNAIVLVDGPAVACGVGADCIIVVLLRTPN
jgi:hypothetical protein